MDDHDVAVDNGSVNLEGSLPLMFQKDNTKKF